jgi:hypothetical protein
MALQGEIKEYRYICLGGIQPLGGSFGLNSERPQPPVA